MIGLHVLSTFYLFVVDVLADDIEPDGEALSIASLSTTCAGIANEDFGLVTMLLPPK